MAVRPESEEVLLEAAARLLSRDAVGGIAGLFKPEALAAATSDGAGRRISRPTAYRLWQDRSQAVVDVARRLMKQTKSGVSDRLADAAEIYRPVIDGGEELDVEAGRRLFRELLRPIFRKQFKSVEIVTGWMLQSASLTSSALWRGPAPDDDVKEIGRQILRERRSLFEHVAEGWAQPLQETMAAYGRRPREDFEVESIIRLMRSLYNGFFLRMFIDPELNDPALSNERRSRLVDEALEVVIDAMFEVLWAHTESATLEDPRRPHRGEGADVFDRLVAATTSLYANDGSGSWRQDQPLLPSAAAEQAGVPPMVAKLLFPGPGDLADSALRNLVVGRKGVDLRSVYREPVSEVRSILRRLHDVAASRPALIAVCRDYPPTHPHGAIPFMDDLAMTVTEVLRSPQVRCSKPSERARSLVGLSLEGLAGWSGVEAVLELLDDHRTSTPFEPQPDQGDGSPWDAPTSAHMDRW